MNKKSKIIKFYDKDKEIQAKISKNYNKYSYNKIFRNKNEKNFL